MFDQIFVGNEITLDSKSVDISLGETDLSDKIKKAIVKEFDNVLALFDFTNNSHFFSFIYISNMKINLSDMEVGLNGTLISGSNLGETKQVALIEDSMGNVGTLAITIGDQTTQITTSSAGISVSEDNNFTETILSIEETKEIKNFIQNEKIKWVINEKIARAISKQLAAGTIPDANGDGIADASDIEAYKVELSNFRGAKLGYLMEVSSGGNNLELMSGLIMNSDSNQSMELMQGMMTFDQGNASMLMKEVAKNGFDVFSHISNATKETGNFEDVRASIVDGMMQNQSEDSVDTMAMMMAVSDSSMSSYLVNEITNYAGNDPGNNLSINVLASFTEMAPDKMDAFYQQDPEMMSAFTTSAFSNAGEEHMGIMSDIMQGASAKNTALLMTNLVENNPEMIAGVYQDLSQQDFDLFEHIESAKVKSGENININFTNTSMYGDDIDLTQQNMTIVADENLMAYQDDFFQEFKGKVLTEIVAYSEGTASEVVADLMMETSGDSAKFMMEAVMATNPEVLGDVMTSFADQEFDIFEHFIEEEIYDETATGDDNSEVSVSNTGENINLSREERVAARQVRKAEKKAARQAKKS